MSAIQETSDGKKKVSFILIIGILLMPYIFSWFTLRSGYSLASRLISFGYLLILVLSMTFEVNDPSTPNIQATKIEENIQGLDIEPEQGLVDVDTDRMTDAESLFESGELIWRRCAIGQTWDIYTSGCAGEAQEFSWNEAKKINNSYEYYNGYADWRLPEIDELSTIRVCENGYANSEYIELPSGVEVPEACYPSNTSNNPFTYETSLDTSIFTNTPNGYYWSITEETFNPTSIWGLDTRGGFIHKSFKLGGKRHILLVRDR